MGWLANAIFGDPNKDTDKSGRLPKAVESWQRADGGKRDSSAPDQEAPQSVASESGSKLRDERGLKIIPEVEIVRLKTRLSSDMKHCDVWAQIKNLSEVEVEVTQVNFLRQRLRFGRFLKPGELHEERIYSGNTPTNDAETRCEVIYKVCENGDYFQAEHLVEYSYEQEGDDAFYVPEEMSRIAPVQDV